MSNKKPIFLHQIIQFSGIDTHFSTSKNISNKTLITFYEDITQILKSFDQEINYEGKLYTNYRKDDYSLFSFFSKYKSACKTLQTKEDSGKVLRTHQILYNKNPVCLDEKMKEKVENNMFKEYVLFRPNITITSTNSTIYSPNDLVQKLKQMDYLDTTKFNGQVFNPKEIADIAFGRVPNKGLTKTGNILTLYSNQ